VQRVTVLRDRLTQLPFGTAYVEMGSAEARATALALNGSTLLGCAIRVLPKGARVLPSASNVPPGSAGAGRGSGAPGTGRVWARAAGQPSQPAAVVVAPQ
jgi:hypothetical protein